MAKKRKVRIDRVIIVILLSLILIGALIFGVSKFIGWLTDGGNDKPDPKPAPPIETVEGTKISLNDYVIYYDDTKDLGFNFIVADINFSGNEAVSYDLSNLQTSEKLNLNDISSYTAKLKKAGYNLEKLQINTTGIKSEEKSINAKILIPYKTYSSSLSLYNNANKSNSIMIDLTKEKVAATTLKLNGDGGDIVVGTTSVVVSKSYISSTMLHLGDRYPLPDTIQVYTFQIDVVEAKDKVKITDAIFIENGTDEEIRCQNDEYDAIDAENIINKELNMGTSGALFFQVLSEDRNIHPGTLLIKFSNQDTWVELQNY